MFFFASFSNFLDTQLNFVEVYHQMAMVFFNFTVVNTEEFC